MEHAEISVHLCNATEKAYQKYGPFICPSEPSELTNCLPRLFEAQDLKIGDLEIRMKMPRLTGERNILIVDLSLERNGEITVFAIDNLPARDNNIIDIMCIFEQTTGQHLQDVLSGRALHTISGEEVDLSNEECCLNGGILTISSAPINSPLQETHLPNFNVQSNGESPPIEDTNTATTEAKSINRGAQLIANGSLLINTVEDVEKRNDQLEPASRSPQVGEIDLSLAFRSETERQDEGDPIRESPRVGEIDLSLTFRSETEGQDEGDPIRDIANKSSSPSPIMPDDFKPLLSLYDYTSDSMDELPEGKEEVNHARGIELPTAAEIADIIFNDEARKEKFKIAYYESFSFRERGGWIFVNPNDPTQLEVVLAPISASDSFQATDMTTIPSINLEDISTNCVPPDYVLAANFHTHPLYKNEEPSKADIENAYYRGMPGIVISRRKIFGYGPERRTNTDEPLQYAPPMEDSMNMQSRKLRDNPFPLQ